MVLVADICGEFVIRSVTSGGNCLTTLPYIDGPSLHWRYPECDTTRMLTFGKRVAWVLTRADFMVRVRPLNEGTGFLSSP